MFIYKKIIITANAYHIPDTGVYLILLKAPRRGDYYCFSFIDEDIKRLSKLSEGTDLTGSAAWASDQRFSDQILLATLFSIDTIIARIHTV